MQFPDFIPAKRPGEVDHAWAAAMQSKLDNEKYALEQERHQGRLGTPLKAYEAYTDLTDTEPLADAVRGWKDKRALAKSTEAAAKTGAPIGPNPVKNVAQAPLGMQTSNAVAGLGGGGMNAGSNAGITALSQTDPAAAARQLSTMLPAKTAVSGGTSQAASAGAKQGIGSTMGNIAGNAAGPVAGGLLSGYMESQNPYTNNERIAVKSAGGASTGALMASAAPLAAAGPVGWAGIAGLAALSLYGMLS